MLDLLGSAHSLFVDFLPPVFVLVLTKALLGRGLQIRHHLIILLNLLQVLAAWNEHVIFVIEIVPLTFVVKPVEFSAVVFDLVSFLFGQFVVRLVEQLLDWWKKTSLMSVKKIESFIVGNFREIFPIKFLLVCILELWVRVERFLFPTEFRNVGLASFARKVLQNVCLTFFVTGCQISDTLRKQRSRADVVRHAPQDLGIPSYDLRLTQHILINY